MCFGFKAPQLAAIGIASEVVLLRTLNNHHLLQNSKSFLERFDIFSGLFKPL